MSESSFIPDTVPTAHIAEKIENHFPRSANGIRSVTTIYNMMEKIKISAHYSFQ